MLASAYKESNKSRFDSYSVRNSVLIISHITFRDCRVQFFFRQPFSKYLYTKNMTSLGALCIQVERSKAARTRFTSKDELGCLDE